MILELTAKDKYGRFVYDLVCDSLRLRPSTETDDTISGEISGVDYCISNVEYNYIAFVCNVHVGRVT